MDEMELIKNDFIERLPVRLLKIKTDIKACDFNSAYREAHNIKGSAGMLGLNEIAHAAKELENKLGPNVSSVSELTNLLNTLMDLLNKV